MNRSRVWGALPWAAAVIVTSILFGTLYLALQQLDRQSANDAPLRLASQVATEVREGQSATIDAQPHVDLSRSLAPFVVIEDAQGTPTAGSGYLDGKLVSLPSGVLSAAAANNQDAVTWQPRRGLRFATVTVPVGTQFVSAGQSLTPIESRDGNLMLITGLAWLVSVLVIAAAWFVRRRLR